MNELVPALILILLLLLDLLVAATASALKNAHPARLKQLEQEGSDGAALAGRVSSQATRLLLALRFSQGLLQVLTLGFVLVVYLTLSGRLTAASPLGLAGILLGAWLLVNLLEYLFENLALQHPERWAVTLAPVAAILIALFFPLVWLMLRIAAWMGRSTERASSPLVTEEEIMTLVDASEEGGVIDEEEKAMIFSIFQLGDTLVREVMVPRIDVLAFEQSTSRVEATDVLLRTGYSRAPVYAESIDHVIGILYVKDLLAVWRRGEQQGTVGDLVREAYFVPEAKKVDDLLTEMQARRIQMAIVVDEYGGTAGVVTFEDIVEEIVGEVRDEYDIAEESAFQLLRDGEYLFSGGIDLDDVNQLTGAELPKDTSETLGGFIYGQLGRVPSAGDELEAGGLHLIVEQVVGRRIRKVRALRVAEQEQEADSHDHRRNATH